MNQDFLLAEEFFEKAEYENALKAYAKIISEYGVTPEVLYKIGLIYSLKGFFKEAEDSYLKAIKLDVENLDYNYALAYLYFINNKIDKAERTVDYILSLNEKHIQSLSLKLLISLNSNEIVIANRIANKISETEEKDDFMFYSLSTYYSKLNRWEKAISFINKAIELNSSSLEYKSELSRCYLQLREYEKAKEICSKIIEENNKYIYAYILLGRILFLEKKYEEATENIQLALKLDVNCYDAHYLKGDVLFEQENYKESISSYKTALAMNPSNEELYSLIGKCYFKLNDYENAYNFYKEAADFNISCAEYRFYMAKSSELLGNNENASYSYSVLKRLEPQNIEYIKEYANFLCSIKKNNNAVALVKSLIKTISQKEEKKNLNEFLNSIKK